MRRFRPVLSRCVRDRAVGARRRHLRAQRARDRRPVPEHYKTFSAALSAIESSYVDKVDSDRLVYGAIRGMLGTLDPHSSFFDPKEYAQMRERQEGRYYGLGITIQSINGDITAASVFEGSPAYKKGIRRGDVIAKIDGEDAKGWTTEQAMKKLRGPKGTVVKIEIKRRGYAEPIPLDVTRDEVQILTVPAHFMLDATTGYIRHQDWGENTDREMQARAARPAVEGHEAAALRHPRESRRPARLRRSRSRTSSCRGQDDRLHARPHAELRSGLSRHRGQRVHRRADGRHRQSQQRQRLGDLHRRAPGSRPRLHRRRDDVRQGARAVGLSDQRRRGAGA